MRGGGVDARSRAHPEASGSPPGGGTARRRRGHGFAAACAAFGVAYLAGLNDLLPPGGDNARYIVLSRAVAAGEGLRLVDMPGAPYFVKTPPLWPIVLAPLSAAAPAGFWIMKLVAVACLAAALAVAHRLIRQAHGTAVARGAVVLTLASPWTYAYAHDVRPEMLYLLLSLGALAAGMGDLARTAAGDGRRHADHARDNSFRGDVARGALAGALAAGAYLTRSAGLVLLPALVVALWIAGRRRRALALGITAVALALPWHAYAEHARAASGGGSGYLSDLLILDVDDPGAARATTAGAVAGRVLAGVPATLAAVGEVVAYVPAKLWRARGGPAAPVALLGLAALLAYAAAVVADARRRRGTPGLALPLYELAFWAVVLIWPYTGPKFIVPIIPLLWARLLAVTRRCAAALAARGWLAPARASAAAGAVLAAMVLAAAPGVVRDTVLDLRRRQDPAVARYIEAASWIGARTPPDAVVMARKPDLLHLHADRRVADMRFSLDPTAWEVARARDGITHVVIDGMGFAGTREYAQAFVEAHPAMFGLVFETAPPATRVYAWRGGAARRER